MSINNQVQNQNQNDMTIEPKSNKSKRNQDKKLTQWRRELVFEFITKGMLQRDIAKKLQVDESTISKDVRYIKEEARVSVTKYFREEMPMDLSKTFNGFALILRDVWNAVDNTNDIGEKIQCYKLIMDVYRTNLDYVYTKDIARDGLKQVEDFRRKYKDQIMKALELERQKQRDKLK